MTELEKFLETKREAERRRREADRLAGVLESAQTEMQRELGVSTLKEAEVLLGQLRHKMEKAESFRDQKLIEFNRSVEGRL